MFAEHFETCWGMFFAFYDKFILELPKERKFVFCGTLVEKHWSTAGRSNLKDRGWKVIFKILLLDKLNLLLWFSLRLKPIVLIYFPAAASKILLISNVLSLFLSLISTFLSIILIFTTPRVNGYLRLVFSHLSEFVVTSTSSSKQTCLSGHCWIESLVSHKVIPTFFSNLPSQSQNHIL